MLYPSGRTIKNNVWRRQIAAPSDLQMMLGVEFHALDGRCHSDEPGQAGGLN